jgi:hypothetical protein
LLEGLYDKLIIEDNYLATIKDSIKIDTELNLFNQSNQSLTNTITKEKEN